MRRIAAGVWVMTPYHNPLNPRLHEKEISRGKLELKVVGIYITPPWEYSAYSLNYNTVFIPSNAIPVKLDTALPDKTEDLDEAERYSFSGYSTHMIPALFSVIIPNDKLDTFKTSVDGEGYEDFFIYNDQGYSQVKDTLPLIAGSTHVFMIASLAGFFSVLALYLALLPRKCHELGMLLSIGAKRSEAVMSAVLGWLIIIIPALILSFIAILITSTPLSKAALNYTMEQLKYNDAFSSGTQKSAVHLSEKFSGGTDDYLITGVIMLGIFILYLVIALIYYILQSKQSVMKLLRRNE
jgi:hypothetical protein